MGAASRAGDDTGAPGAAEAEALAALRLDWGTTWDIGCGSARWRAAPRDGTGHVLTRASAEGLALALRISHGRHPR
jgi:hypothetical protein